MVGDFGRLSTLGEMRAEPALATTGCGVSVAAAEGKGAHQLQVAKRGCVKAGG